jgi:hypothetical protein
VEPEVSRRNFGRARRVLVAAFCAVALVSVVAAPAAMAGDPAPGQYTLHVPDAGTKGGGSAGTKVGDSGGTSSAVPILALGAVVIAGGAGALAYARRRRQTGATT